MASFLDLPIPFLLLVPVSLAAGVDFFLAVLVLAVLQGWGLEAGGEIGGSLLWKGMIGGLILLYAVEALSEIRARTALVWHTLQLLVRPVGGVLLALTLLEELPLEVRLVAGLGAGVVCAFTHVLSWGRKLTVLFRQGPWGSTLTRILGEDLLVLGLVVLAVEWPGPLFLASLLLLLLGLLFGTPSHHAVRFGTYLLRSTLLRFLNPPTWTDEPELPEWVRSVKDPDSITRMRGIRGGLYPPPGLRGFRECWLLEGDSGLQLLFKVRGEPRVVPWTEFVLLGEAKTELTLQILLEGPSGSRSALFLQRDFSGLKSHK